MDWFGLLVSILFLVPGAVFLVKPQVSWYLKEGRAYGKKEMPEDRKTPHRIRGAVLFAIGLMGVVGFLWRLIG